MRNQKPKSERIRALAKAGYTDEAIAKKVGTTKRYVVQLRWADANIVHRRIYYAERMRRRYHGDPEFREKHKAYVRNFNRINTRVDRP